MIKLTIEIPCSNKLRKQVEKEIVECIDKRKPISPAILKKLFKNKSIVPYTGTANLETLLVASKIIK